MCMCVCVHAGAYVNKVQNSHWTDTNVMFQLRKAGLLNVVNASDQISSTVKIVNYINLYSLNIGFQTRLSS